MWPKTSCMFELYEGKWCPHLLAQVEKWPSWSHSPVVLSLQVFWQITCQICNKALPVAAAFDTWTAALAVNNKAANHQAFDSCRLVSNFHNYSTFQYLYYYYSVCMCFQKWWFMAWFWWWYSPKPNIILRILNASTFYASTFLLWLKV